MPSCLAGNFVIALATARLPLRPRAADRGGKCAGGVPI